DPLDVSLMVTRGYSSLSFLWEAAKAIRQKADEDDVVTVIYILGDYDPSGQDIIRNTTERLMSWSEGCLQSVEPLAVTLDQIAEWDLPTRPTKRSDPRAKGFGSASVELDAIPPDKFRTLIRDAIMSHVDEDRLRRAQLVEKREQELLRNL